jgi:glucosylceramidase
MKKKSFVAITGFGLLFGAAGMLMNTCKSDNHHYSLLQTTKIYLTSEKGDKMAAQENAPFQKGLALGNVITIYPQTTKQKMDGIGSSITESSAFVLAHLDKKTRAGVMRKIFAESGANFSMTRTHIGACDFSVEGKYSYADKADDATLESFSIFPDKQGFDPQKYPGIIDKDYDLLPMIKEALAIKKKQKDSAFKIISSAWTAPKWMKDIEEWYIPGSEKNNWQGTGGSLKPQYVSLYADYLVQYLNAYQKEGVPIWGITPVNEPHGNNGQWESMRFTPESQNEFIKNHLRPKLEASKNDQVKLLFYDQNRDGLEKWAKTILGDSVTAKYVYGAAVHWYASSYKVFEQTLEKVHSQYPASAIIHTEGCIDDLGKKAPAGIADPEKFQESGWFENDEFWWNPNATDWAYTAEWAPNRDKHPIYTPVHRYARNIIVSIDHWLQGWIDWNVILDRNGGPNHVGNFCGAPIMIDTKTKKIYYTPIYYVLAQFSKTIRPGDKALQTEKRTSNLEEDDLHVCATINTEQLISVQLLNTSKSQIEYHLQIENQFASIIIPANSVQTVQVQL